MQINTNKVTHWSTNEILTLSLISGINSQTMRKIPEEFDSFDDFCHFDNLVGSSVYGLQPQLFFDSLKAAKDEADKQLNILASNDDYHLYQFWDKEYPEILRNIDYPPLMLYVWGDFCPTDKKAIAIVGTRHCTLYGKLTAEKFASCFALNNIIVVSGLAYGIDTVSHLSTIKSNGITFAVIASGLDKINPAISHVNAQSIVDAGGAIVSEHKFGTSAQPGYFPRRNRIISGLSIATVVIESKDKGGSLITARFAFDQQREVFAVPGRINDEKSQGTNYLIKKNIASAALSPEDVLKDLGLISEDDLRLFAPAEIKFKNEKEKIVYNILTNDPMQIDSISTETGIEISELLVVLLNMEFSNLVRKLPGQHYIRGN
ncbi:MAG: DNA-processing protein DprA [Candidatus Kapabacteria bacterium]|nr:DNA-processing protein DprA [Candidatus Kapabacteria bacterium]